MERLLKIILPLVLAALVAGGYYVYALPNTDAGYVLVAKTDIQPGQEITKEMLEVAGVAAGQPIKSVNPKEILGKRAKDSIRKGEMLYPERVVSYEDENERLYTVTVNYDQANAPLIRPGMAVEVWHSATKTEAAKKITDAVIHQIKAKNDKIEFGEKVSVVLRADEVKIQAIETARGKAELFLVVPVSEVH
jgi:Flp pilus assembly protein CpaB